MPFRQFKSQQSEFINRQSEWYGRGGRWAVDAEEEEMVD
jgi:hypothetical protein